MREKKIESNEDTYTCYTAEKREKKTEKVNVCQIVHDNIKFVLQQAENLTESRSSSRIP